VHDHGAVGIDDRIGAIHPDFLAALTQLICPERPFITLTPLTHSVFGILQPTRKYVHGMDAFSSLHPNNKTQLREHLMNKYQQLGMTMIELLVTVSIVAILATMAAPSLREMVENNRLTALNNQLVSTLNYVRAESVKRAFPVTMCVRNSTGSGCATSGGFENGWIVFVDCDGDNALDASGCNYGPGNTNAAEEILLDIVPDFNGVTVTGTSTATPSIRYKPNGGIAGVSGSLTLNTTTQEYEQSLNVGSTARYKIKIQSATGRIASCRIGTTGC
jgi:type IV fimbrial biogenesis protein FimT